MAKKPAKRILLVEDEEGAAKLMEQILTSNRYNVMIATNGVEATMFLQEERFDLAIIDLILPDMNGTEIIAFIRHDKRLARLPVIVSTAMDDEDTKEKVTSLGVEGFLSKPYSIEDLLSVIRKCIGR